MALLAKLRSVLRLGEASNAARLVVGQRAPDFALQDTDGTTVRLADLIATGPVLLAFFPKAFTGGCTRELRAYRDKHQELVGRGARVVGISTDDRETLARFRAALAAPYTFLSDPDGAVSRQYGGVWLGTANRITVTVSVDGTIARITSGLSALFPGSDISACAGTSTTPRPQANAHASPSARAPRAPPGRSAGPARPGTPPPRPSRQRRRGRCCGVTVRSGHRATGTAAAAGCAGGP